MRHIGTTVLLSALLACSGGTITNDPDAFALELLANNGPRELRTWLYDDRSTLGELQTNGLSTALADELYAAGAVKVFGVDIEDDPDWGSNTGRLVIELPKEPESREAVFLWATPIAEQLGFDAEEDVGQRYLFVMLD